MRTFKQGMVGVLFFAALALMGIGCGSDDKNVADRGVFKSGDKGTTWESKSLVPTTTGQKLTIAKDVDVRLLVQDPKDSKVLYAGSLNHGLWITLDAAETWQRPREAALQKGRVFDISVDPEDTCTIFVALNNAIYKSVDCARSWVNIFEKVTAADAKKGTVVSAVQVNPLNTEQIFAATSAGDVLRSVNGGQHWSSVNRIKGPVDQILINPKPEAGGALYIATVRHGIYRTTDLGETWTEVSIPTKSFRGSSNYITGVFDPTQVDALIVATEYGLLKTADGGATWVAVKLVSAPGADLIYSLAVNPKDNKELYYGTRNAFYRSNDGGESWETKKVPTRKAISALLVDRDDPNVLYLGARLVESK